MALALKIILIPIALAVGYFVGWLIYHNDDPLI